MLPTSVTNNSDLSLDLKTLYLCHLPLCASLRMAVKDKLGLAWWLISLPPKMIIKSRCFLTTCPGWWSPLLDIFHFIRVSKYDLEDLLKGWCHWGNPHERRVIAAAEERICMGARGGLYFSTWCVSSQRHDRPPGQVSVQIRWSFCAGAWSKKIWCFINGWYERKRKMKILLSHVLCQASFDWALTAPREI